MAAMPSAVMFEDILDFLASSPSSEEIIAFEPTEELQQRLSYLLEQNRKNTLASEERIELDEFLRMNHFMTMLKLKVRQKLAGA